MLQRSMAKCYADTITAYVVTGEREQILTLLTKLRAEPADRLTKQVISELTSIINED
jgi:Mor family transcriptional regulator